MESDEKAVQEHLSILLHRIAPLKDAFSQLILRIAGQYPGDVGVFCLLLLNYIVLKPGQAIFLAANEPHAYLSGGNLLHLLFYIYEK